MKVQINVAGVFLLMLRKTRKGAATILIPNCFDASEHDDGDKDAVRHHPILVEHDRSVNQCKLSGTGNAHDLKYKHVVFSFDPSLGPGELPKNPLLDWSAYDTAPLIAINTFTTRPVVRQGLSPFDRGPSARLATCIDIPAGAVSTCPAVGSAQKYVLRGGMKSGDIQYPAATVSFLVDTGTSPAAWYHQESTGGPWVQHDIKPVTNDTAYLTIGNLCSETPAGWDKCRDADCSGGEAHDKDFKWLYRLLRPYDASDWTNKQGLFSYPVGICPPASGKARSSKKLNWGATTSTCFPAGCEDC